MRRHPEWSESAVALRAWTRAERRVVLRGFWGRSTVAIEPFIIAVFFSLLPIGLVLRKPELAVVLAPIFACAALAFLAYAVALMVPSTRALFGTFLPIYVVDGYIRYRRSDRAREPGAYVAVLDAHRQVLGEWSLGAWPHAIRERELWPALVEFSDFGGIHRIDGRSTGVLPEDLPPFGIGVVQHAARLREDPRNR